MSKIYNMIPGKLLNDTSIVNKIFALIDSVKFDKWVEVNEKVYALKFFEKNKEFYVMYLDPMGVINRLYDVCCDDIVEFMKEHIDYEFMEGIDIAICTKEVDNAVICNHDGQIFLIKEEC